MKLSFLPLAAVVLPTSTNVQAATNNLRGKTTQQLAQLDRSLYNKVAPPVDNTRGIFFPEFRYVPWDDLDSKTQKQAVILEYTPETWNQPGKRNMYLISFLSVDTFTWYITWNTCWLSSQVFSPSIFHNVQEPMKLNKWTL